MVCLEECKIATSEASYGSIFFKIQKVFFSASFTSRWCCNHQKQFHAIALINENKQHFFYVCWIF